MRGYQHIHAAVGVIRLNRSQVRNALCDALISELRCALDDFEGNDTIGAIVLTGDERAFAVLGIQAGEA
jgi:enoyl-CoA hydratase/carnithine racemase